MNAAYWPALVLVLVLVPSAVGRPQQGNTSCPLEEVRQRRRAAEWKATVRTARALGRAALALPVGGRGGAVKALKRAREEAMNDVDIREASRGRLRWFLDGAIRLLSPGDPGYLSPVPSP